MNQPQQVQITASAEDLKGRYSNGMMIQHSKTEFILDFFFVSPQNRQVVSRVLAAPAHVKRLLGALKENIERYEATHGKIEDVSPDSSSQDDMGYKIEK